MKRLAAPDRFAVDRRPAAVSDGPRPASPRRPVAPDVGSSEGREQVSADQTTPRPWAAFATGSEGCSVVAAGRRLPRVARLTSGPFETCQADAALIVEAVNAYDRLKRIEEAAREYQAAWALDDEELIERARNGLLDALPVPAYVR